MFKQYRFTYTAAPGEWQTVTACEATSLLAALRRTRRAFPPKTGTRLQNVAILPSKVNAGRPFIAEWLPCDHAVTNPNCEHYS